MYELDAEEAAIVDTVREFVDREVRPVVRELEHANAYPQELIEQMKALGIFGLAVPAPYGEVKVSTRCYAMVTEELARGWMSLAGAMGGHTVVVKLIDGEEVRGWIEYYDKDIIRITRDTQPNLFIYKSRVKYLYEDTAASGHYRAREARA